MGMSLEEIVFLFTVAGHRRPQSRSVSASLHLYAGGGARRRSLMHLLDLYLCLFPRVGAHHLYPAAAFVFTERLRRRARSPVPELATAPTSGHVRHVEADSAPILWRGVHLQA